LTETIGVEPSPDISIDGQTNAPVPNALRLTIEQLIQRAFADRPDIMAQIQEIRKADDEIRNVNSTYRPKVTLSANVANAVAWPAAVRPEAQFGTINTPTWAAAVNVEWTIFDGGARRNRKELAESGKRQAVEELRDKRDQVQKEVWNSYIAFRTALRQEEAAVALLSAADTGFADRWAVGCAACGAVRCAATGVAIGAAKMKAESAMPVRSGRIIMSAFRRVNGVVASEAV